MAGVGIAAAIGFVFALTVLNSNNAFTGTDSPETAQRLVETQPDAASSFFFTQQEPPIDEGAPAGGSATMLKQDESAASSQQEMSLMQQDAAESRPALSSVIAVTGTTGEVITEVTPGSQFAIGKPVFIRAQFTNPDETDVLDHTLVMTLAHNGTGGPDNNTLLEQAANFHGNIGANEGVDLEFYWNPDTEGEYELRVYSLTPGDLAEGYSTGPILSILIQAVSE